MAKKICIPAPSSGSSSNDQLLNSTKFFDILNNRFPNKINYSLAEVAEVLNLSYDFVREKISCGEISAIKFGDRYMVNVFELARILEEGV
ncbi:MAG: helix-turn-helix domain-containing protein [Ignavibacteriales bacterium]|nr:helix-turn-helix domain-containing protein [Ignavibacteriales bacterium]